MLSSKLCVVLVSLFALHPAWVFLAALREDSRIARGSPVQGPMATTFLIRRNSQPITGSRS